MRCSYVSMPSTCSRKQSSCIPRIPWTTCALLCCSPNKYLGNRSHPWGPGSAGQRLPWADKARFHQPCEPGWKVSNRYLTQDHPWWWTTSSQSKGIWQSFCGLHSLPPYTQFIYLFFFKCNSTSFSSLPMFPKEFVAIHYGLPVMWISPPSFHDSYL